MNAVYRDFAPDESMPIEDNISNIPAEQALLGAIFVNNDALGLVTDFLTADHFYEPLHQKIFEVTAEMIRMGKQANPVTIRTFLQAEEMVGNKTVYGYTVQLAAEAVGVINAADYGRAIYDLATRRALITVGEALAQSARDMPVDVDPSTIGEEASGDIARIISAGTEFLGAVSFGEAIDSAMNASGSSANKSSGIKYRLPPLERLIGSLYPGQLIILGGATKQGKTALAGQIAMGAAREGTPVWIYSGEMTPVELAMREISRETKIPVQKQKRGAVTEADLEKIMEFRAQFLKLPIYIQNRRLTLTGIKERCRNFVHKKGRSVLFIDHIGLVDREKSWKHMSDWEFGQEVTKELKAMARDLDCPVIASSQLKKNTFAENKGPLNERFLDQIVQRKPRYTDLIGAVERDADHVVIPFRPEVFLKEHEPLPGSDLHLKWEDMVRSWNGRAQIVLALSRESQWPRHTDVGWDGPTTTFFETGSDAEREPSPEYATNPMGLF